MEFLPAQTTKSLSARIDQICHLYTQGGFTVRKILMDDEFEKLQLVVPSLNINTTAAKEHVPDIKQRI